MTHSKYIFYFGTESPFSHWYRCHLVVDEQEFSCAGQFIMFSKALLFNDREVADKILKSKDPKRHRYLGKEVSDFRREEWQRNCMQFSFDANSAKFRQNESLKEILLKTGEKILVEASPYDRVWGVGLSEGNPKILEPRNWRGRNFAGESLMQVRNALKSGS